MAPRVSKEVKDPEATYTKAAKAELAEDYDSAFRLYISAAEDFLHEGRTSTEEKLRSHYKSRASVALQRAEKIKAFKPDLTPVLRNPFLEQNQLSVLKKSSRVNGRIVPLWADPSRTVHEDLSLQPDLSLAQIDCSTVWKSPVQIHPNMCMFSPLLRSHDLFQRVVTDCSVHASIVVCLEHHRRFNSRLGLSTLFPQDENGMPCSSSTNTHDVSFHFNGGPRRIAVDNKLPVSSVTDDLACLSTGSKHVIWPSLIEKAYMKLMGGYNFPGSKSTIDLHTIIGWIPEDIDINHSTFQREKFWTRILTGFTTGRCVFTFGTPDRDDIYWRDVHLLPAHCYAVIDVEECEGERHVTILDPWAGNAQESPPLESGSRVLTMSWDEVCDIFDAACVSWDPAMFAHSLSLPDLWRPKSSSAEDGTGFHRHLRLRMTPATSGQAKRCPEEQRVWFLLTRHVTDTRRTSDYISLRVESEIDRKFELRIDQIAEKGTYTNSAHVLVQATPQELKEGALSLIASYDGDLGDVGFTLTAYSTNVVLSWDESPTKLPYCHRVDGKFTAKNSGGNHSYQSYMINPQYHLHIYPESDAAGSRDAARRKGEKAKVRLVGQAGKDTSLNVCVVWSNAGQVFDLFQSDIVCTSGTYSYGYATTSGDLLASDYTIIVSSFEPQRHLGPFSLRVESSRRFDIRPIPQEGAGMYSKVVKGSWEGDSAAGGPRFNRYLNNPTFELQVTATCQIKARLQLQSSPSAAINVTIFPSSHNHNVLERHITTSGPYTDLLSGAVTPPATFQPGNYLIVPSTFQGGVERLFRIEVFSSAASVRVMQRRNSHHNPHNAGA